MKSIYRLGRGKDAGSLLRFGRRFSSPLFQIVIRPNNLPRARFMFVASRAVDKRAVVRNRLRRRASEYVRTHYAPLFSGRDIAVIIKKEAGAMDRNDFYEALRHIFSRVP